MCERERERGGGVKTGCTHLINVLHASADLTQMDNEVHEKSNESVQTDDKLKRYVAVLTLHGIVLRKKCDR